MTIQVTKHLSYPEALADILEMYEKWGTGLVRVTITQYDEDTVWVRYEEEG